MVDRSRIAVLSELSRPEMVILFERRDRHLPNVSEAISGARAMEGGHTEMAAVSCWIAGCRKLAAVLLLKLMIPGR